jgi:hypothetical protein
VRRTRYISDLAETIAGRRRFYSPSRLSEIN